MDRFGFGLANIGVWGGPALGMIYADVTPFMFLLSFLSTLGMAIYLSTDVEQAES